MTITPGSIRTLLSVLACCGIAVAQTAIAPTTAPPDTSVADSAVVGPPAGTKALAAEELLPPADDAEIARRIELVRAELNKLGPTTQPGTAPASAPADRLASVRSQLAEVLRQYLASLLDWQTVRKEILHLQDTEGAIKEFGDDLRRWDALRKEYEERAANPGRFAWSAKTLLSDTDREYETATAKIKEYETLQVGRGQQLTSYGPDKAAAEEAAAAGLAELQRYVGGLQASLDKAGDPDERLALVLRKRLLEWRHNLDLLRVAMFPDRTTQLEIARQQDADRLAALRGYLAALQAYRTELQKAVTRYDTSRAKAQLERTDLPAYETRYWAMALAVSEALADFQASQVFLDEVRSRTSPDEIQVLRDQIEQRKWYLDEFMRSHERRSGESVVGAYRVLGDRAVFLREKLKTYEAELDRVNDRIAAAGERRDQFRIQLVPIRAEFENEVRKLRGDELVRARDLQARLTSEIGLADDRIDTTLKSIRAYRDQLGDIVAVVEDALDRVALVRGKLYWMRLAVPDRGPLNADWVAAQKELRSILTGKGRAGELVRDWFDGAVRKIREVRPRQILVAIFICCMAAYLGIRARRFCRAWVERKDAIVHQAEEQPDKPVEVDPAHRIEIQLARATGWTAPVLWPVVGLLAYFIFLHREGTDFPLVLMALGYVAVIIIGEAVIRAMFDTRRPHLRIIQCGDDVARYHRGWLRILGLGLVLLLPWPRVLWYYNLAQTVALCVWDSSVTLLLLLLFVYLARRRMFSGWVRAAGSRSSAIWVRLRSPLSALCVLATAVLVVLEFLGYAALVDYLIRGLGLTVAIVLVAKTLRGLLAAWAGLMESYLFKPAAAAGSQQESESSSPFWRITAQVIRFAVGAVAVAAILQVWGVSFVMMREVAGYKIVSVGSGIVTPARLLGAVVAVIVGVIVSRSFRAFLHAEIFPQSRHIDRGTQAAITALLHYSIIALAAYVGLRILLIDLGALTILLGTLGLGLGLGLQPLFVNFISGLMILFERQIKVGDTIELPDGTPCEVLTISMRSTRIRTPDNIEHVIPNGEFINGRVINWTLSDARLRARMQIGVAYGTDPQRVKKLLLDVAHRHPDVLVDPPPEVWFLDFGDNALIFVLAVWFANAAARWRFLSQVRFEMTDLFKQHGIDIPFPQRTISLIGDKPLPVTLYEPVKADPAGLVGDNKPDVRKED